jgi:hypothetical protein
MGALGGGPAAVIGRGIAYCRGVVWRHWIDGGIRLDLQKSGEDEKDCMRFILWRFMGSTDISRRGLSLGCRLTEVGVGLAVLRGMYVCM